jgi:hypothetical protein
MGASITIQGKTIGMWILVIFMFMLGAIAGIIGTIVLGVGAKLVYPTFSIKSNMPQ